MGSQHQPLLWFYMDGHSFVGAQTEIRWRHYQHGPAVGGGGGWVSTKERDEELSWLSKMVWAFLRSLAGQLSNPDDEAYFQAKLYKNINPGTTKASIAATCRPNCAMHNISTSANSLPINVLRKFMLIRISWSLRIPVEDVNFSSPLPFLFSTPITLSIS